MKFKGTKHLVDRLMDRLGYNMTDAKVTAWDLVQKLNEGDYLIVRNHKDTGFIAVVDEFTVDVRPEQEGTRAVTMVFHKFNQWNHRGYAKAYWPLVLGAKMDKESAHLKVCAKLGLDPR